MAVTLKSRFLTRALWGANALAVIALLAVVLFRVGTLVSGGAATLPDIRPLQLAKVEPAAAVEPLGTRNPFDASGAAWHEAEDGEPSAGQGQFRGLVILPGVRVALSDGGGMKPGDTLGAGRIVAIDERAVVVDTAGGRQPLEPPGSRRPRLQDLNQGGRSLPAAAAGNS